MILENMMDNLKSIAVRTFNQSKSHAPIYIMNINDNVEIMMCEWTSQKDKDETVNMIKTMIKNGNLKEFIFVAESWVLTVDKDKSSPSSMRSYFNNNGSLSSHPQRKEALFMQYSSPEKEQTFKADIDRSKDDVTLGEWEDMGEERFNKGNPLSEGRMQNIFAIASADNN